MGRKFAAPTTVQSILHRYEALRDYCDEFWNAAVRDYPNQFACGAGCCTCCELQSVNFIEAACIADFRGGRLHDALAGAGARSSVCPFLTDGRCAVYPARPLICRTHGLLLKSDEFSGGIAVSCPFNFTTAEFTAEACPPGLDIDAITTGLAKLNIAFCMLLGDREKALERVALCDLASGRIGPAWFGR